MKKSNMAFLLFLTLGLTGCFSNNEDNFIAQNLDQDLSGGERSFFDLSFKSDEELLKEKYSKLDLNCTVMGSSNKALDSKSDKLGTINLNLLEIDLDSSSEFNFKKNGVVFNLNIIARDLYAEDLLVSAEDGKSTIRKKSPIFEFDYELDYDFVGALEVEISKTIEGKVKLQSDFQSVDFMSEMAQDQNKEAVSEDQFWPGAYCLLDTKLNSKYKKDFPTE